jgi:pimeloyl-ACP methyl ester carboxylesterase
LAFRVAQQRPELLRKAILAEPGGELDASLAPAGGSTRTHVAAAAERIAAGDVEGGLALFIDAIEGEGGWRNLPEAAKQELRDNARTLLGQVNEQRRPYTRADAESIRVPVLFIGGGDTPGMLPVILRALAAHVPSSRVAILPGTSHAMFAQDPVGYCAVVEDFLMTR